MSAARHLHPEEFKFYHGTAGHDFKPGEMLTTEKANRNRNWDISKSDKLYMTNDVAQAEIFAYGHMNYARGHPAAVYEVAPTGLWTRDKNNSSGVYPRVNSMETSHPLKVIKRIK